MPPLDIGWSDDSRYLIYSRQSADFSKNQARQNGSELVSADVQTKQMKVLAPAIAWRNREPATARSLDGKRLAVPVQNKGRAAILLTNPDGAKQVMLKNEGAYIVDLLWSPNSQYIVYVAGVDGEEIPGIIGSPDYVDADLKHPPTAIPPKPGQPLSRLVIARADGSGEKAFTFQHIHILKWEPDKNLLLYLAGSADDNRVMALNPITGTSVALTDALPERIYHNTYYNAWGRWTFDTDAQRRFVVFTMSIDWAGIEGAGGGTNEGGVYLTAWDGSVRRQLNRNIRQAKIAMWSPDGRQMAFSGRDLSFIPTLEFYSYDGQRIWTIRKLPDADSLVELNWMSLVWIPCPPVR